MSVSDPLSAAAFSGLPQVGAVFGYSGGATTSHFCSGSVVSSDAGDIVVTAAHCVYDDSSGTYIDDIAFVPGYHDGQQPYGVWTPSKIVVADQWINDGDPDYDVAFLVVHQPGSGRRIEDAVGGGDALGTSPSYSALARVVGYPSGTEQPITCTNYTRRLSSTQLEFDCAGFPGGTSGGPFLTDVDPDTGLGTVSGVIGGYQTGGDTPDVSYSAYFGSAIASLFRKAEAAG
jgi:V8-like Glu-specific endopeptidase